MRDSALHLSGGLMSDLTYARPSSESEIAELTAVLNVTYLRTPDEGLAWRNRVTDEHMRVVKRGGNVIGGCTIMPGAQYFGGSPVSMTGVASVGVAPEHRSGGVAATLMRGVLEELRAEGVATSALFPATQPLYRRCGWELAGSWIRYRIPIRSVDVKERNVPIRTATDADMPAIKELYEATARRNNGHLQRSNRQWDRKLDDSDGAVSRYVVEGPEGLEGYVIFAQKRDKTWKYDLEVRDIVVISAQAGRRIWSLFSDHRSFGLDVNFVAGPADPMLTFLREQEWERPRYWTWMNRIVDVRNALESRGYPASISAEVNLEVVDDVITENSGHYKLAVSGGKATVTSVGQSDCRVDVRGLASLYTGYMSAHAVGAAGYASGNPEALEALTAIFAGPAPWLADFF